jgi:hypothetical protein
MTSAVDPALGHAPVTDPIPPGPRAPQPRRERGVLMSLVALGVLVLVVALLVAFVVPSAGAAGGCGGG